MAPENKGGSPDEANNQNSETVFLPSEGIAPAAPVDSGNDSENNHTILLPPSGVPETDNSRTIDSRTISMEQLSQEDRTIWEAGSLHESSQTIVSHSETSKSNNAPSIENHLLLLSRRLHDQNVEQLEPGVSPDYEVLRTLGRGGMGVVYEARQASLDRVVALKVIQLKDGKENNRSVGGSTEHYSASLRFRREQFLSEAVVTGDLDHPNIVPIYDVAKTQNGDLFYSMKKVEGTPWDEVIREKSQEENLEILLKVADAVAFAHSRGIVHRDIKPENVMLGDYGIVMLMDWGLAVPTSQFRKLGSLRPAIGLGGSPAYMAPELAIGPVPNITPASDIYLLGAVLYEIISGIPPHAGSGISQCLRAAVENIIQPISTEKQGELYQIAMRAMAKSPSHRYESVQKFQSAIRQYRSHTESINLSERATEDIERARTSGDYADYARAVFGFEESLELWRNNTSARVGVIEARLAYAEEAHHKEDFDLGLSLLDERETEFQPMIALLKQGQKERANRRSRLIAFRRTAAALLAIIFIGGSGMSWTIFQTNQKLTDAVGTIDKANETIKFAKATVTALESDVSAKQNELRVEQEKVAVARKDAEAKIAQATMEASEKIKVAEREAGAKIAQANTQVEAVNDKLKMAQNQLHDTAMKIQQAQAAAAKAEADAAYVNYASSISQARSYLDQNQHGQAYQILAAIRASRPADQPLGWEWERLWYEANRARRETSASGLPVDGRLIRFGSSGHQAVAVYDNGELDLITLQQGERDRHQQIAVEHSTTTASFSPDERLLAAAGADGLIRVIDLKSGQTVRTLKQSSLRGSNSRRVNVVRFLTNQLLVAGFQDSTIRLWDIDREEELGVCWNIAPVVDMDLAPVRNGNETLIAAAVSDLRNGRVVVWRVTPNAEDEKFTRVADLLSHSVPVSSVAFHPDGETIASADLSGRILSWKWEQVGPLDYRGKISSAVRSMRTGEAIQPTNQDLNFRTFVDPDLAAELHGTIHSSQSQLAHRDSVQQLRFSPDGQTLVSASNDLTLKLWATDSGKLRQTLRGQGGPVRSADFSPTDPNLLMSAGSGGLFSWDLAHSREIVTFQENQAAGENQFTAHNDEILSASFDRSGTRIVTASRDHTARVLEIDPKRMEIRQVAEFQDKETPKSGGISAGLLNEGGQFVSLSMRATADKSRLFVGGADGFIRIWNVRRATEIGSFSGTGLNSNFAISPDGRLILSGSSEADAKALLWHANEQGQPEATPRLKLNGHQETVTAFAISADGKYLFTGDRQGIGILWNAETGMQIGEQMRQHAGSRLNAAAFSPDGKELFLAGDNRAVSRTEVLTGKVIEMLRHDGFVTDLSVSLNGSQLLTVSQIPGANETRSILTLWNLIPESQVTDQSGSTSIGVDEAVSKRTPAADATERQREIRSIRFSTDSSTAYSVQIDPQSRHSELKIWEINSNEAPRLVRALEFPTRIAATEIAMQGPPGQVFTLNGDAVFLWDLKQLGHLKSYRPHAAVTQATFSSDGKFVATSSRTVKIWNVAQERSMAQLEYPHAGATRSVCFSPVPGSYEFLTGGDDGEVKLWKWHPETEAVEELRTFAGDGRLIRRVSYSEDGKRILVVGDEGLAKILNTDGTGTPLILNDDSVKSDNLCGAFSSDNKWIVIGSKDRIARLWRIDDDLKSAKVVREFTGHADEIADIKFLSSDSLANFRIVSAGRDALVRIWDPRVAEFEADAIPRELLTLRSHGLGVSAVDSADRGRLLMSAGLDGEVILWPTELAP